MEINGNVETNKTYSVTLHFNDEHEASTFQAIMQSHKDMKPILIEYSKDAQKMAHQIFERVRKLWK